MILVIGGACQGKLEFGITLLGREKIENTRELCADGRSDSYEAAFSRPMVSRFHEYIRRLMAEGADPMAFSKELLKKNGNAVIIANEIGCGIVPADPFEREYRDENGRVCQYLAREAETVYRVVCGLGIKIKG